MPQMVVNLSQVKKGYENLIEQRLNETKNNIARWVDEYNKLSYLPIKEYSAAEKRLLNSFTKPFNDLVNAINKDSRLDRGTKESLIKYVNDAAYTAKIRLVCEASIDSVIGIAGVAGAGTTLVKGAAPVAGKIVKPVVEYSNEWAKAMSKSIGDMRYLTKMVEQLVGILEAAKLRGGEEVLIEGYKKIAEIYPRIAAYAELFLGRVVNATRNENFSKSLNLLIKGGNLTNIERFFQIRIEALCRGLMRAYSGIVRILENGDKVMLRESYTLHVGYYDLFKTARDLLNAPITVIKKSGDWYTLRIGDRLYYASRVEVGSGKYVYGIETGISSY